MKKRLYLTGLFLLIIVILLFVFIPRIIPSVSPSLEPETSNIKRSSSAIAITSDGNTLLVVNPDSNSLTFVDTSSMSILEELQVGVDPRCVSIDNHGNIAYISNRGSDSVSIIDLEKRKVISEVEVGNKPYGVVVSPEGDILYIAEQGSDRLTILDTRSLEVIAQLDTEDRPSGLAILNDGTEIYITHLLKLIIKWRHFQLAVVEVNCTYSVLDVEMWDKVGITAGIITDYSFLSGLSWLVIGKRIVPNIKGKKPGVRLRLMQLGTADLPETLQWVDQLAGSGGDSKVDVLTGGEQITEVL